MKLKKLLLFIICCNWPLFSQETCGTPDSKTVEKVSETFSQRVIDESPFPICVNVYFHILRTNAGTGGISVNQLDNIINNLNRRFNTHSIHFVNTGYDFINSTAYQNIDNSGEASSLSQTNAVSNALNYYIVETLWNEPEGTVAGTSINIPSTRLVIRRDAVLSETSSHEVGHCFNLKHTFQGTKSGTNGCAEAINGSNCSSCGDSVCDTPADADVGPSQGYNPDMLNIMSYYFLRNHFTPEQAFRMRVALNTNPTLSSLKGTSCSIPKITGASLMCSDSGGITYTLENGGIYVSWQTSPNLTIVSSNNTSITVKPLDTSVNEAAYIKAVLPYQTLTTNIWVGVPRVDYQPNDNLSMCRAGDTVGNNVFTPTIQGGDQTTVWEAQSITNNHYLLLQGNEAWISLMFEAPFNYLAFQIRASNSCGFSPWLQYYIAIIPNCNDGGGSSFLLYPNPVSSTITIQNSSDNLYSLDKFSDNILEINLYDQNGILKIQKKSGNLSELDMSDIKKGHYFIQIVTKANKETHQIIKN
ncbi:zinc-dependent metalloprotease [Flavobacterium hungaricum]|uniref:T9SS C-terminal target domain-containing protein n=1 Tax=Flavobacterium hungaricum TaxID=2082725 RepID=A0ABR9TID9_9FLAO|nr:zinc-dependent metalloprotease [Flavobacterium hungaricum]MBE8725120.1 T9SS C-terminal target domain-containing protein [Flavobacterium hungaricum]